MIHGPAPALILPSCWSPSSWFGSTHCSHPGLGGEDPSPPAADGRALLVPKAGTTALGLHPTAWLQQLALNSLTHTQVPPCGTHTHGRECEHTQRELRKGLMKKYKSMGQTAVTRHRVQADKRTDCPILYTTSPSLLFLPTPL